MYQPSHFLSSSFHSGTKTLLEFCRRKYSKPIIRGWMRGHKIHSYPLSILPLHNTNQHFTSKISRIFTISRLQMSNGLSIILQVHYSNGGQSMMALYINPITTLVMMKTDTQSSIEKSEEKLSCYLKTKKDGMCSNRSRVMKGSNSLMNSNFWQRLLSESINVCPAKAYICGNTAQQHVQCKPLLHSWIAAQDLRPWHSKPRKINNDRRPLMPLIYFQFHSALTFFSGFFFSL